MNRWFLLLLAWCALLIIGGYALGRYVAPDKVVTKTVVRVVEKEVIKWRTKKDTHEYKTVVEHRFPDGTLVTKHTDEKDTHERKNESDARQEDRTGTTERTVERTRPGWRAGVLLETDITRLGSGFGIGGRLEKRLFGPVWLGAEATKSGRVGASLMLEF